MLFRPFIFIFSIFIIQMPAYLFAHSLNPHIAELLSPSARIYAFYENYSRPTVFGYNERVSFSNCFTGITVHTAKGMDYGLSLGTGGSELAGRTTSEYGYEIRGSISGNIWGDLVVFPAWRWNLTISHGLATYKRYQSYDIDIEHRMFGAGLALICARQIGFLTPYAGAEFYTVEDNYSENMTGTSYISENSGVSMLTGIKITVHELFYISLEGQFLDVKSISGAMNLLL
ncbi:MAG: hypothetical protein ABIH89_02395 [Elusimicrobiota bacterium]